jgi:hypothetical protein
MTWSNQITSDYGHVVVEHVYASEWFRWLWAWCCGTCWCIIVAHQVTNIGYMFHIVGHVGTWPYSILKKGGWRVKMLTMVGGCYASIATAPSRPVSVRVSFALNRLPLSHFYDMTVYLRREKKWVLSRWNSLGMITSYLWVLKLNAYETIEWNSPLRVDASSNFISFHMTLQSWKQYHETPHRDWP